MFQKLKQESNKKVEYRMVPSDVINEEDLEESAGDISALKGRLNRNSVNGSIKSQTMSRQSPFARKSKAAELPEEISDNEKVETGERMESREKAEEGPLPVEKDSESLASEKFVELKDMVKSIELPRGRLAKVNIEPAPSQSYGSVERPKQSRGSMKSVSKDSKKSESRCSRHSVTRQSVQ